VKVGAGGVDITQDTADASAPPSSSSSVNLSVQLSPGVFHQVALGVRRSHVTLHVDCDVTVMSPWRRLVASGNGAGADADENGVRSSMVLSIGKAFIESSRYPHFEVRSLVVFTC